MKQRLQMITLGISLSLLLMGCGNKEITFNTEYPDCFQTILQQREESSEIAGATWDYGLKQYEQDSPDETIMSGYADSGDIWEENAYKYQIKWLKLGEGKLIENLSFDLHDYFEKTECTHGAAIGAFYEEETGVVYVVLSSVATEDAAYSLLLEIPVEEPKRYTITEYPGAEGWFGPCYCLGDRIFLNMGSGSVPCAIDIGTKELYHCDAEYQAAVESVEELTAESVYWFYALEKVDDTLIYMGTVQEAMDEPVLFRTYLAYKENRLIGTMIIEEQTGEITVK